MNAQENGHYYIYVYKYTYIYTLLYTIQGLGSGFRSVEGKTLSDAGL